MKLLYTIQELQAELSTVRKEGKKIGLVPTMGALHQGHASLVKHSVSENDVTVVSIFLNPTQFNDTTDLEKYPRTLEADCALLESVGATYVFAPSVEEMYPEPDTRKFSYPTVDAVMEGAYRPGHFNGVCQIVSKLFYAVEPDRAYFGLKDFQQIAVIRAMVKDLKLNVKIISCPIVREQSGLAMSSRNALLTEQEKATASNIYNILAKSRNFAANHSLEDTKKYVEDTLNSIVGLEVQYYSIVDGKTLKEVHYWDEAEEIVGCITVFCGDIPVRLIDHIEYKGEN